jgi:hypothetical protein
MGVSRPGWQRDHDAWHRDRGGRRWRRWATAAQWVAGRQRQDGRAAAAGQGDGVSPSYLLDFNERDIPHTTGIHKQVGEPKKVRKKVSTFCVSKKVRLAHLFFHLSIVEFFGNTQMIARRYNLHTTFPKRGEKKKGNLLCTIRTTGLISQIILSFFCWNTALQHM